MTPHEFARLEGQHQLEFIAKELRDGRMALGIAQRLGLRLWVVHNVADQLARLLPVRRDPEVEALAAAVRKEMARTRRSDPSPPPFLGPFPEEPNTGSSRPDLFLAPGRIGATTTRAR